MAFATAVLDLKLWDLKVVEVLIILYILMPKGQMCKVDIVASESVIGHLPAQN